VNTFFRNVCYEEMFKLIVVNFESGVEYKSCLEFCDDRALKISAMVHFPIESYGNSNPVLTAVQTARQGLENGSFEQLNVRILPCVEYQSCAEYCDDCARQNSKFLHKGRENYENFGECRPAASRAGHN
jgi:hypothetical protein